MKISELRNNLTERQLQEMVIALARARGWLCYHTFDSRRSAAGFPDLVLARNGVVLFAELKSEKGRLREDQRSWINALGEIAHVWRPSDFDEIKEVLS